MSIAALPGRPFPTGSTDGGAPAAAAWQATAVTDNTSVAAHTTADLDELVAEWLTVPELAALVGVPANRARQMLAEGRVAAVRQGPNGALMVPGAFLAGGAVLSRCRAR